MIQVNDFHVKDNLTVETVSLRIDCLSEGYLGRTYRRKHNLRVGDSDEGIVFVVVFYR